MTVAKTHSFGGLAFWTLDDGFSDGSDADVAAEHVPWGDYTVIHLGGKGPEELTISALVDGNPRATLRLLEGTQNTLNCPAYAGTAVLKGWKITQILADAERVVSLTFLVDVD